MGICGMGGLYRSEVLWGGLYGEGGAARIVQRGFCSAPIMRGGGVGMSALIMPGVVKSVHI